MKSSVGRWGRVATAIGLALAGLAGTAVTAGATAEDAAAPEASTKSTTVLLVHGFDGGDSAVGDTPLDSKTVCDRGAMKIWRDGLLARGWTDVRTVGYYKGDQCLLNIPTSVRSNNTISTSIDELAKEFANLVWVNFTSRGRPVAISAHSMGGLVTRRALDGVMNREPGFPPGMWVQDVVTSGTAHNGALMSGLCPPFVIRQCDEMRPASLFLLFLDKNPQGRDLTGASRSTDWTLIGSECDIVVPAISATTMDRVNTSRPEVFKKVFTRPAILAGGCLNPAGLDHTETATHPAALDRISTSLGNRD